MKIAVIGAGYVGMATMALMLLNKDVTIDLIEKNKDKRKSLLDGECVINEDGIVDAYQKALSDGRVHVYPSMREDADYDFVFICVGTPQKEDGYLDRNYLYDALNAINTLKVKPVAIIKSTLPVGTTEIVQNEFPGFDIVFSPEFLREGTAYNDSKNPTRIVIGTDSEDIYTAVANLYKSTLTKTAIRKCKFLKMNPTSAELVKLASNSYLAVRLSFFNELSLVAETCGADIKEVIEGVTLDARIGKSYANPSIGFAGPCLPKDINQLRKQFGVMHTVGAAMQTNEYLQEYYTQSIQGWIDGSEAKSILFLGIAFKSYSDDCRTSRTLQLYHDLKINGDVTIYDPRAKYNASIEGKSFDLVILSSEEYIDMLDKIEYKVVFDLKSIIPKDKVTDKVRYIGKQA